jgi:hypothetical protein
MKKHQYSIRTALWRYKAHAAWHFLTIGKKKAAEIKELYGHERRGWGSLPVTVTLGSSTWKTSIFPTTEGEYILPVKKSVRANEGIGDGDRVSFTFIIRT